MKLFVVVYNDARLLGHFLAHYARAGVTRFCIATAPEFRGEVERHADRYAISVFDGLDVFDSMLGGTAAVSEMRRLEQHPGEWVVIVDLDEFIEFPCELASLIATADREGANVVRGIVHDRFAADGQPAEVTPECDLPQVFPITSRFKRDIMQADDKKAVLVKGHLKPSASHHLFVDERVCSILLEISHYKWIAGAVDRLRVAYRRLSDHGVEWGVVYKRVLNHYDAYGRFAWEEFDGKPKAGFVPEPGERCADCGAPIAIDERDYSLEHFARKLCRADQKLHRLAAARK